MTHPRPETTPGVFLEHFDLSWPLRDGADGIIYGYLFRAAMEAAAAAGWTFRSYSSVETPGTDDDWIRRQIRAFPTLILFRDGVELGRHTAIINTVQGIQLWGNKLLGIETEKLPPPTIPKYLLDRTTITPSGIVLRKPPEIIVAPVAEDREHLRAMVKRSGKPRLLARLAPEVPSDPTPFRFLLEWLVGDHTWREQVHASLEVLIIDKQEPVPWAYLCHHTTTAANLYSGEDGGVFWEWVR